MINLKTTEEIAIMKEGGGRLRQVVNELLPIIKPGIATEAIDKEATGLIKLHGGEPSFKRVEGYRWSMCTTVNEQIVHTPPSKRTLKNGDVFTMDIGMYYKGFNTDFALSLLVGEQNDRKKIDFLETGKTTLYQAIDQARVGNRIGAISKAIEEGIEGKGYFVIRELTGHGVGQKLHEEPFIPGYLDRPIERTPVIRSGLVIAIEVIYSMGSREMAYEDEAGWSIITRDLSLSACFEHTVAVTEGKAQILT